MIGSHSKKERWTENCLKRNQLAFFLILSTFFCPSWEVLFPVYGHLQSKGYLSANKKSIPFLQTRTRNSNMMQLHASKHVLVSRAWAGCSVAVLAGLIGNLCSESYILLVSQVTLLISLLYVCWLLLLSIKTCLRPPNLSKSLLHSHIEL